MKLKIVHLALLTSGIASAALLAGVSQAAAQTETIEYIGVVSSGSDGLGLFGPANGSLTGDAFIEILTVNLAAASLSASNQGEVIQGFGASSPLTAALTINQRSYSLGSNQFSDYFVSNTGANATIADDVDGAITINNVNTSDDIENNASTSDASNTYVLPTAIGQSYVIPIDGRYITQSADFDVAQFGTSEAETFGSLQETAVFSNDPPIPTAVSAAPEPSTWALMIAGVGMVGAMLRFGRRRGWATATA